MIFHTLEDLDQALGILTETTKPKCGNCNRELCQELDAYYGSKDKSWMQSLCATCRFNHSKEFGRNYHTGEIEK